MYNSEVQKIYNKLINEIVSLTGKTIFTMGDITIEVEGKDAVGGLIQEWLKEWCIINNFDIVNNKSSQEFPDYYVGEGNNQYLEIKTFDYSKSANFDLANFESYCESLSENPEKINADYLIFAYIVNGVDISIEKIWLKKIWEITSPSKRWALKTQTKRDVIYNIRPSSWESQRSTYKTFNNKDAFITALFQTQQEYKGFSLEEKYKQKLGVK